MTCCGHGREALRAGSSGSRRGTATGGPAGPASGSGPLRLVPREPITLYARGTATGRTYVFRAAGPGSVVDAKDAPALLASGLFRVDG